MKHVRVLVVAAAAVLVLAACGGGGGSDAREGEARTVEINMVDIAFKPDTLTVARGETVRFLFTNDGKVAHDAFVGDKHAQADHESEMRDAEDDGHGGHGDERDAITVEPGEREELTHTFDEAGAIEIGCHQPGHYDAGMKIAVDVA